MSFEYDSINLMGMSDYKCYIECSYCKKVFIKWKCYVTNNNFCSRKCLGRFNKVKFFDKSKHPRWKGDRVGYYALHDWVEKVLGKPSLCNHCGLDDSNRKYEWANKSHSYKRHKDDWIRLCVSCHRKYDYTDEMRSKITTRSMGNQYRARKVKQYDRQNNFIKEFSSIKLACTQLSINPTSIVNNLRGRSKSARGFIWKYSDASL